MKQIQSHRLNADQADSPPLDLRIMNAATLLLTAVVCVLCLGYGGRWLLGQPAFALSNIVVEGDTQHHNAVTLMANVGGRIHGNFFTLDLAQAKEVFESVPWVRHATVQRLFPNRLRVTLQEHQGMALWGLDSETRMVNSFGEIFEADASDAVLDGLPRLVGMQGQSAHLLGMYTQLNRAIRPLQEEIELLELSNRGAWRMSLGNGTQFELGHGAVDEVVLRLKKFISSHSQVLNAYQREGLDRVETVDLRYSMGYAIRLNGVSTLAAAELK